MQIRNPLKRITDSPRYKNLHTLGLGFWIFLLLIFCIGFVFMFYIQDVISILISDYGYIGIFVIVLLLELLVQPIGPDLPLILGVLAGMSNLIVLLVVLFGAYVALYLAYLIGRNVGAAGIEKIIGAKTFAKVQKSTTGGKWFMLIGATTPVPYVPYLVGMWDFNFKDTMLYVVIPRTVRLVIVLVLTYYFGVEILNIHLGS